MRVCIATFSFFKNIFNLSIVLLASRKVFFFTAWKVCIFWSRHTMWWKSYVFTIFTLFFLYNFVFLFFFWKKWLNRGGIFCRIIFRKYLVFKNSKNLEYLKYLFFNLKTKYVEVLTQYDTGIAQQSQIKNIHNRCSCASSLYFLWCFNFCFVT